MSSQQYRYPTPIVECCNTAHKEPNQKQLSSRVNNCDEIERIIRENERLVYFVLHKYYPRWIDNEDIVQAGRVGLWKASTTHDTQKGSFSTYATRCIVNEVRSELRTLQRTSQEYISLDAPMPQIGDGTITMKEGILDPIDYLNDVDYRLSELRHKMSERDLKMLSMKACGYTYQEIGRRFGLTRQRAQQILKKVGVIAQKHYDLSL